jgi:hypothetical protein
MSIPRNRLTGIGHFGPNPDVICQRMGEVIVLLNLRTDRFYELNSTAARLWELLCEQSDARRIEETLFSEFEVEPVQLAADITALVASLQQEGLLIDSAVPANHKDQP